MSEAGDSGPGSRQGGGEVSAEGDSGRITVAGTLSVMQAVNSLPPHWSMWTHTRTQTHTPVLQ